MTGHPMPGTLLLVSALLAIGLLLFLILYWKVHAFLALLFSSIVLAVLAGMPPPSWPLSKRAWPTSWVQWR
jgi:H+/gluconate symporter-like permease